MFSKEFSAEAFDTMCFLARRSPSKTIECRTSLEVCTESYTDYSRLREFGSPSKVCVRDAHRQKKDETMRISRIHI